MNASGQAGSQYEGIESPYDPEAKFCRRQDKNWTGYRVHFSETCDDGRPRLMAGTDTTIAPAHEVRRIGSIHDTLAEKGLLPDQHLVDSAYASADPAVGNRTEHDVKLIGPAMPNSSWQSKSEEAFGTDDFEFDWTREEARRGNAGYRLRQGIEGTISQGVRMMGLPDVAIDAISVGFRLLSGDTVVASASAFNTDALQPGQQGSARADFFNTESLGAFACYEYGVEVSLVGPSSAVDQESYLGTCGG